MATYHRPWMYPKQLAALFCPERYAFIEASTKTGKAQPLGSVVWSPAGKRLMGDLKVGDTVLTPTGQSKVRSIHPQGVKPVYRVTFSDGASTRCTEDHLWNVRAVGQSKWKTVPLADLMQYPEHKLRTTSIPTTKPIQLQARPVPMDPWLLGLLLGDGGLTTNGITLGGVDDFILDRVRDVLPPCYSLLPVKHACWRISLNVPYQLVPEEQRLVPILKSLGLWGRYSDQKFIPEVYLNNSVEVRLEVLRGLMDADGSISNKRHGQPCLGQTSEQLAKDVTELVESLGGHVLTSLKENVYCRNADGSKTQGKPCWLQNIVVEDAREIFSLPRKIEFAKPKKKPVARKFRSIVLEGEEEVQCIKLEDETGLYLTDHCIVTHNTVGCMVWLIEQALTKAGSTCWWVAPVYPQAKVVYNRIKKALVRTDAQGHPDPSDPASDLYTFNESALTIKLSNGSVIFFKSAEKPDNLYGEDVNAVVLDEATRMREEAWFAVRSTLTATQGRCRIIGNVKGKKNWAYLMGQRAKGGAKNWHYAKLTAWDAVEGGVLTREEVEDAQATLPPAVFAELYLAEPSDDGSNPFDLRAIADCTVDVPLREDPAWEHEYDFRKVDLLPPARAWGWDFARGRMPGSDWTVGVGLNGHREVIAFDRFQGPWDTQYVRIRSNTGNVEALCDSTGLGDAVVEELQHGGNYEGYKFSSQSKQVLMEDLAIRIQQRALVIPRGIITDELEMFEFTYSRTGVRYSAPEGMHDDCVMALALANHQLGNGVGPRVRWTSQNVRESDGYTRPKQWRDVYGLWHTDAKPPGTLEFGEAPVADDRLATSVSRVRFA